MADTKPHSDVREVRISSSWIAASVYMRVRLDPSHDKATAVRHVLELWSDVTGLRFSLSDRTDESWDVQPLNAGLVSVRVVSPMVNRPSVTISWEVDPARGV